MRWQDFLHLALRALTAHRLRSFLTLLGIAVGIAAVILLTSIGEGLHQFVLQEFTQFGTNIVKVTPGRQGPRGGPPGLPSTTRELTLDDAARIICCRSRLLRQVRGQGAMAVVGLPLEQTRNALRGYEGRLSVAVSNSPRSTVVSGEGAALEEVLARIRQDNVFCRLVKVDVASHSPQMDPLLAPLTSMLTGLQPRPADVPLYSTVTGELIVSAATWRARSSTSSCCRSTASSRVRSSKLSRSRSSSMSCTAC